jgi:outer membrane cobalamin receptor
MASRSHSGPDFPRVLLSLLVPLISAGCSPVAPGRVTTAPAPEGRLITQEEIRETHAATAWDVLRRAGTHIRMAERSDGTPGRMVYRGKSSLLLNDAPMLVIDGVKSRDFRILHFLPAANIATIRILSATEGTRYFGTGAAGGIIVIETRTGPDKGA